MVTLKEKIIDLLNVDDGFTDREITDKIIGQGRPQQNVNIACRDLEARGQISRVKRHDGKIGNYIKNTNMKDMLTTIIDTQEKMNEGLSEDEINKSTFRIIWVENASSLEKNKRY